MSIFKKLTGNGKKGSPAEEFTGLDAESLPLAASESAEYYSFLNPSSREMLSDERAAGIFGGNTVNTGTTDKAQARKGPEAG